MVIWGCGLLEAKKEGIKVIEEASKEKSIQKGQTLQDKEE